MPLVVWHHLVAWKYANRNLRQPSVGRAIAIGILVQSPANIALQLMMAVLGGLAAFTMYDLEFDLAPQIVCGVLCLLSALAFR